MKKIKLSQNKFAIVDDENFEYLNQWNQHAANSLSGYYACKSTKIDKKFVVTRMHRVIMKTPKGMMTDHINGNTLDNRKENLRICTHSENQRNRVQHRRGRLVGYTEYKNKTRSGEVIRYIAQRRTNGKKIYLGYYNTPEEAHQAFMNSFK